MKTNRPRPSVLGLLAGGSIVLALILLCTVSTWLPQLARLSPTTVQIILTTVGGLLTFPVVLFAFRRTVERVSIWRLLLAMGISLAVALTWGLTGSPWIPFAFVVISLGVLAWQLRSSTLLPLALAPAVKQLRLGNKVQALSIVNDYLRTKPDQWQALQLRAAIELSMMNLPDAERDAKRVTQVAPNQESGYSALGNVYLAQGLYQRAKDNFERALRLKPHSPNTNYNYGLGCYRLSDYATAKDAFEVVLKKASLPDENMLLANYYLAKCYEALGDLTLATMARERLKQYKAGYERLVAESNKLPDYDGVVAMRAELDEVGKLIG